MPGTQTAVPRSAAADAVTTPPDKRTLILDAAIKVFAEKGYHGSRVSDIAREAGIAYGLVYHYFKNKEEILRTIFDERWSGFQETLEAIAEGAASTRDKLVSVAALVLNAYRLRPDWVKVLVLEIQRSSRFTEPEQIRAVGGFFDVLTRIVREGQQRDELRGGLDPRLASYVFAGALEITITSLVLGVIQLEGNESDTRAFYVKVANTVVDIFFNGVVQGGER